MKKVLIVESDLDLGRLWASHIETGGTEVTLAVSQREATEALTTSPYDALVVDLTLPDGSALAVADLACFRQPRAKVIFVTKDGAFSDGSIFAMSSNASAFLHSDLPPEDLAAIVDYHAAES